VSSPQKINAPFSKASVKTTTKEDATAATPTEQTLLDIWREVLPSPVERQDNFFDLGGNSLLAMRIIARVRARFNLHLPIRSVFDVPILQNMAGQIDALRRKGSSGPQHAPCRHGSNKGVPSPLSAAQARFWLLQQMDPENTAYRTPVAFRLHGPLNVPALQEALYQFVLRHAALRTTYREENGSVQQIIVPGENTHLPLPLIDLRSLPDESREAEAIRAATAEIRRPFNLQCGPLLFSRLFQLSETDHLLTVTIHHIASDGWSLSILYREISKLYQALRRGQPSDLPALPYEYSDFAHWQQRANPEADASQDEAYWRHQLRGAPTRLLLSTDFPKAGPLNVDGNVRTAVVDQDVSQALLKMNRQENATLFMTLMAAFQTLLFRQSGQSDFVIGVPIASRSRPELENLFGCFLNTLSFRGDLSGNPTFRTLLARVRETALAGFEHQEVSVEKQMGMQQSNSSGGRRYPFQVLFNHLNFEQARLELPGLSVHRVHLTQDAVNADLELYSAQRNDGIVLQLAYRNDLFRVETVDRLLHQLLTLLRSVAKNPDERISRLQLVSDDQRALQRTEYHSRFPTQPFREFRREEIERSIPARFEEQVRRDPKQLAVQASRQQWTYEELNERANRIAHALIGLRGPGAERVAILLDHDAPMLAAILGVLKAGKTYVPLQPRDPQNRLTAILADCGADTLITGHALAARGNDLRNGRGGLLNIDSIQANIGCDNPGLNISPDALSYVLYTSGSTGAPKGVIQNHRNVQHFARVYTNNLHLGVEDRLTLFSSYAHDAAVMDIFGALLNGATLHLQDVRAQSPQGILAGLKKCAVTVFHATPTVYRHLVGALEADELLSSVRAVVLGGERMTPADVELYRRHFAKGCLLVNGLGPTESTVSLQYILRHDTPISGHSMPVGYPVDETEVLLLDEEGHKTEISGEIAIRSRYLALGYWKQPELTRERFLPDPDGGDRRVYRTGDLARRRPDETLEFIARKDRQVKIRGFRVELEEIETALHACGDIREAVVIQRQDVADASSLVAYLIPERPAFRPQEARPNVPNVDDSTTFSVDQLRAAMASRLPDYMVPSSFVLMQSMPLTPNGKVDCEALPVPPSRTASSLSSDDSPQSHLEMELMRIWQRLFGRNDIGRHDNFFDLGGHSLLAVRLMADIGKLTGSQGGITALFQAPTISRLGQKLAQKETAASPRSLVPLQPMGDRPPIYFVHGWRGDVFGFFPLAQRLGTDQPAYGLQAVGLDGREPRHTKVEQMAAHYVREIRAFQPKGPYRLAGFSAGGLIAYEMAQQLHREGEAIALLALIDTLPLPIPTLLYLRAMFSYLPKRFGHHLAQLRQKKAQERVAYLSRLWDLLRYWVNRNRNQVLVTSRPRPDAEAPTPGRHDYYVAVAKAYKITQYRGTVDIFIGETTSTALMGYWNLHARDGVNRHPVCGTHMELLSPQHLDSFARTFKKVLQESQDKPKLHARLVS
jgi:amino acid adenylation domain-containing protein